MATTMATTNDVQRLCDYLSPTTLAAIWIDLHKHTWSEFLEILDADVRQALVSNVGEEDAKVLLQIVQIA